MLFTTKISRISQVYCCCWSRRPSHSQSVIHSLVWANTLDGICISHLLGKLTHFSLSATKKDPNLGETSPFFVLPFHPYTCQVYEQGRTPPSFFFSPHALWSHLCEAFIHQGSSSLALLFLIKSSKSLCNQLPICQYWPKLQQAWPAQHWQDTTASRSQESCYSWPLSLAQQFHASRARVPIHSKLSVCF